MENCVYETKTVINLMIYDAGIMLDIFWFAFLKLHNNGWNDHM